MAMRLWQDVIWIKLCSAQHALEGTTSARAVSYVSVVYNGRVYWGAGIDSDIVTASVKALVGAVNLLLA